MKVPKLLTVMAMAALFAGCASVDEQGTRLADKPNMQFGRSMVYNYSSKFSPQLLPGLPASGGDQPSTCALCR